MSFLDQLIKPLILSFLVLVSSSSYSFEQASKMPGGNPCNQEHIKNTLFALRLSPNIQNNGELLAAIKSEYGVEMIDVITNEHKYFEDKDGAFDLNTLDWIVELLFKNVNTGSVYFLAPFEESVEKLIIQTLTTRAMPNLTIKPLFLSKEQFLSVRDQYKKNDFKYPIQDLISKKEVTENMARKMAVSLYKKVFEEGNYAIVNDLKSKSITKLIILGHGQPGEPVITSGNDGIHLDHLVDEIKKIGMPSTADIELFVCYAGASFDIDTGKSEEELIGLFLKKNIDSILGDERKTFAFYFAKELFSNWSDYSGDVIFYTGALQKDVRLNTYFRLGDSVEKRLGFSVGLKNQEADKIFFDINEMRKIYQKDSFEYTQRN